MIKLPTPETKWYVTEYPNECDFAVTDGNEILVTIIGGNTIGDQCDLASRIAKLPDLERERAEANESSEAFSALAWKLEGERNELRDKMADALQEVDLRTLDYLRMREAIIATLEENRHLADGDDCTLAKLKSAVPEWK